MAWHIIIHAKLRLLMDWSLLNLSSEINQSTVSIRASSIVSVSHVRGCPDRDKKSVATQQSDRLHSRYDDITRGTPPDLPSSYRQQGRKIKQSGHRNHPPSLTLRKNLVVEAGKAATPNHEAGHPRLSPQSLCLPPATQAVRTPLQPCLSQAALTPSAAPA